MTKKQIYIILGTRPEAIKLAPVIQVFQNSSSLNTSVILTGQHREMVEQVMRLFNLKATHDLEIMQPKQSLSDITCRSLQGLEGLFQESKPDLVLVQGDTTTAFAATLAAFYQKIPVGHVEAGLRTDDLFNPYPEEANRRLISQLTQLHFAPTPIAVENLERSGVLGEIHLTGNTVIDALLTVAATVPVCDIPGLEWEKYRVLLATVHRRENWGEPLHDIAQGFLQLLDKFGDTALLLPLHRNPIVREPLQTLLGNHPRVFLTEPLDYAELVGAIMRSHLLLTDSGGLQEEAPSVGKPVLVLRETTERPEAVTAGTAKLVGTQSENIFATAAQLLSDSTAYEAMANAINPFGDGHAAKRILQIVQNYLQLSPETSASLQEHFGN
ncbi:MAG: UDP-N-acetylglucosamine 2-epimerase (non-hydrolyzing) [Brasilonema octagenarum HA4186-MV1]|jgi:UDP-N-acetylglucosamine 2-epimerase (non-hydrolysing)|uniref:UDP-N-acetylglucosamine 2-epimerase (non-hydrolyzing) n=2 Tax=Brasilonema TaxID=383614 RepID=A0A856M613_9CYAN|nr:MULTISPECIES: UDP-N-acetylglucosamine 2-epimerase (non-hydrolyzing) [Brasilonema]MBW4627186.1 UDP-N-acetylglucosamine 2-epimerase (non-hydrolyzing) [Brasilonema octagenarum HA4186-MV1]NMF62334.1 UDP-N-acetylglucosamine 2-epimerase (non-hydrolyzing) [Brasilonema octagenarum UFV-OR1]QDL06615.1 UDP-N-acetylglucosamine 2-epimerase (non-hydrolyzing) [Brasilonema sennae CENA114]QDL12984.1 UDP-N-acetylglucosamine 2-epimerase (non-hydrolyzing) [Brasilonema octagenarum UFV-E1]